jgi:alpha-beta hydrolase superfamily lysophospholipase
MKTVHHWLRSGDYSLLSHADLPDQPRGTGVLVVPPFGWEDISSYRPLRFLARTIAQNGFPVLRFDLPGTGDSSGSALDPGLFDAWVQSVGDAARELRNLSGAVEITLVGVRLGAMLALLAAARGADLRGADMRGADMRDLVLWAPSATGRGLLRELQAFASLQRTDHDDIENAPPPPFAGLDVGGFLLTPETQRALESVTFPDRLSLSSRRILILSRDDLPADTRLARALPSCHVTIKPGRGYSAMMAIPHEAVPPAGAAREILEFLKSGAQPLAETAAPSLENHHGIESIYTVRNSAVEMFGILSEPSHPEPPDLCLLFLNPGATRHIGPNRMWVEAARRWTARGVPSLRLDLAGIGESDGDPVLGVPELYQDGLAEQVESAIESLKHRIGARRFATVGLCSGAFWALHAASRNRAIRSAVLLNPRLFSWDPEVDQMRALRRAVKGLVTWRDWRRVVGGRVQFDDIKRMVADGFRARSARDRRPFERQMESFAKLRRELDRNQTRVTLLFSEGEPLLREMQDEAVLPPESGARVRSVRVPAGGHTFRPLWVQKLVHELIDAELEAAVRESRPRRVAGTT